MYEYRELELNGPLYFVNLVMSYLKEAVALERIPRGDTVSGQVRSWQYRDELARVHGFPPRRC
jgi:hypothetical protein